MSCTGFFRREPPGGCIRFGDFGDFKCGDQIVPPGGWGASGRKNQVQTFLCSKVPFIIDCLLKVKFRILKMLYWFVIGFIHSDINETNVMVERINGEIVVIFLKKKTFCTHM